VTQSLPPTAQSLLVAVVLCCSVLREMASVALNQELQALVLQTLERHSSIADTSKLSLPSAPSMPVEPQVVQAVLASLASRSVCNTVINANSRLSNSPSMNRIYGDSPQRERRLQIMEVTKLESSMLLPNRWRASQ
jgi:hypothetical protein